MALAVAIQFAPLAAPLLISTDAWTTGATVGSRPSRMGTRTAIRRRSFPTIPAFPHLGEDWRDTTSVYGPAFTLASEPLALAAGESDDAAAWIYKTIAAVASLGAALLAALLARRALACAFAGWNPLLALHLAGGGHNDAWLAVLVMGALAFGVFGRPRAAGGTALAVLVKWIPLLFLPLHLLEARANGRRVGLAGFAIAFAVVIALATWRYDWHWLSAFGPLAANAAEETSYSIPHRLQELGLPRPVALGLCLGGFAAAYVALLRRARQGEERLALAGGIFLLATPWLAAWYMAWIVPLAAAEEDRVARVLAFALCVYLMPQAVPVWDRPGGRRARRPRRTRASRPGSWPREPRLSQAARSGLRSPAASRQPRSIARRGHTGSSARAGEPRDGRRASS